LAHCDTAVSCDKWELARGLTPTYSMPVQPSFAQGRIPMCSGVKRLLIVKAASDVCAAEVEHLQAIADMFGIQHRVFLLTDIRQFQETLCDSDEKFDFIYLAAHANTQSFGERDGNNAIAWRSLGEALCESECLNPESILMLGCCRGGLKQVALELFGSCDQIDYICGPRWKVADCDISVGFHVFIYNMVARREQPSVAVDRASRATNYEFFCHDRVEMQDEIEEYRETTYGYR
jgi:hypothetical protein